ncbi:VOC family protein [Glaciimonas immobilis]|uniref:2,3-dihydroxybiphenyl 1,2-dioxygenase n=1 Tax=Glaciimonas immobilis TaxID=728004 RepID=A0A840RN41_9BURK|nr:VOC family protein [Glaciimonas immobilis]KAF3998181.1 hypothetical protein HAV38_11635 [Glaciimonas immobilis]MBB5199105.1 2,3-dihydroxybiphenyl 1,2-dioxygenase [Glaciimonas immobilis]
MKIELESAYIVLESSKPAAISTYLTEVVGLMPGQATREGALTWRDDDKSQRVMLVEGASDDVTCIGFEATSLDSYEKVISQLRKLGLDPIPATDAQNQERRVERMIRVQAPWGVDVEVVFGLEKAATAFASVDFPNGFITKDQGFGHFVFAVASDDVYEASVKFATKGLGLKLSDYLKMPMGPIEMNVSFFHCNARHHSLAIAHLPVPVIAKKLHHINFEVNRVTEVGVAYERALASGTPIANMLGQHENDGMVSFYSVSPDGWQVEIGATGRQIGDDWCDVREYNRISLWGHQPPAIFAEMQGLIPTAIK